MTYLFSRIPIVGALSNISLKAQCEALVELCITVIFSTLPIWFASLIVGVDSYALKEGDKPNFITLYLEVLKSNISNGELFMYVAAVLGPTLYLGLTSFGKRGKPFPWVRPQLVIAVLINFIATAIFFNSRGNGYAESDMIIYLSIVFYFLSLLILFPSMAFDHESREIDPREAQRDGEDEFAEAYRKHRN